MHRKWKFLFCCSFFILFFKHNSKGVWHDIQTIWTPNNYFTISNFHFLHQSGMRAKIGELWIQTFFAVFHYVRTYTDNSKIAAWIETFCSINDCSTIRQVRLLGYSRMWDLNGELWLQTHTAVSFWYADCCRMSILYVDLLQVTALLLKVFIVWFRVM